MVLTHTLLGLFISVPSNYHYWVSQEKKSALLTIKTTKISRLGKENWVCRSSVQTEGNSSLQGPNLPPSNSSPLGLFSRDLRLFHSWDQPEWNLCNRTSQSEISLHHHDGLKGPCSPVVFLVIITNTCNTRMHIRIKCHQYYMCIYSYMYKMTTIIYWVLIMY